MIFKLDSSKLIPEEKPLQILVATGLKLLPSDFNSKTDYDDDGLPNDEEIKWDSGLIKNGELPSILECMNYFKEEEKLTYVEQGLDRFIQSNLNNLYSNLENVYILPIRSDPLSIDGDGDGALDLDDPMKLQNGICNYFDFDMTFSLLCDITECINQDFNFLQDIKHRDRNYSINDSLYIVLANDKLITGLSNKYMLPKSIIQATLMREIICLDETDMILDDIVLIYYNTNEVNYSMLMTYCLIMDLPVDSVETIKKVLDEKVHSSTGLGQIQISTAIKSYNWAIKEQLMGIHNLMMNRIMV